MSNAHARLSPSSSDRWINCPASVRAIESMPKVEEPESPYAAEGTQAHTLGELRAALHFGLMDQKAFLKAHGQWEAEVTDEATRADMERYVQGYVEYIEEHMSKDSVIFLEQRMDTGVPESWGTSDAVIIDPGHVQIIDLKYGAGVPVSAKRNSQLRLYALGALDTYDGLIGDVTHVTAHVYQPRLDSASSETLTVEELLLWREEVVIPAAVKALYEPYAHFGPSDSACRWCPLAGTCRPRMEWATRRDFGDLAGEDEPAPPVPVELLTPEDMGRVLPRLGSVTKWTKDVEAAALDMAYAQGQTIPGYKVVRSGGRRQVKDHAAAIQRLIDLGFPAEKVAKFSLLPFGELEKALGKDTVSESIGDLISKTEGRESLAKDSDKRPAVTAVSEAAADFA